MKVSIQGHIVHIDRDDLHFLKEYCWHPYLNHKTWYIKNHKSVHLHKLITKNEKDLLVDHINGNGLDNRKKNLRLVTPAQNNMNRICMSKSGYKGVWKQRRERPKMWIAYISVNSKRKHIGTFNTPEEAALAYNTYAKEYFGEYAKLNNI